MTPKDRIIRLIKDYPIPSIAAEHIIQLFLGLLPEEKRTLISKDGMGLDLYYEDGFNQALADTRKAVSE